MFAFNARVSQSVIAISAFALVLFGAATARAQTFGLSIADSVPNLGSVASAASGDTVFAISSTGAITKSSGNGARVSTTTSVASFTVTCNNNSACDSRQLSGTISNVGTSGRAGSLTFTDIVGTNVTNESGTNPRTFRLPAIGRSSSKTFQIAMTFPIKGDSSGAATGTANASFQIALSPYNGSGNSVSDTGTATATVLRSISLDKTADLAFGRIVRPISGSSTITVSATTGLRSISGSAAGLPTPSTSRAAYAVTGEGGRTLSISIPATVTMTRTGGSDTLSITTTNTLSSPKLSSILGNAGSYNFWVGGSFPITSTTTPGAYSGVFTVSAAYN